MRICIYTETALPMLGGQELTIDALAREFVALGHKVVVLAPNPRSPLKADDGQLPYPVHRHARFISTWRFVDIYGLFLRKLQREQRFDIIHCHSVFPSGYLALRQCRGRVPVVVTSHGGDVVASNPRFRKRGVMARTKSVLREASALVAISRFTHDAYQRLLAPPQRIHDIPNGVHTRDFAQPAPRPPDLDPAIRSGEYILFLGRLARRKGVDVLLEALAGLVEAARPLVVLAGDGEERAALEVMTERLGIAQSVRFLGVVRGVTKTYLLQNSIATAIPSRGWEAFPLVVLESFAAGRPVIATRVPGLEDLVFPGRNGWLAEPESPASLMQILGDVAGHRTAADRLGATARADAAGYDWNVVARRYLTLFEGLIGPTKA